MYRDFSFRHRVVTCHIINVYPYHFSNRHLFGPDNLHVLTISESPCRQSQETSPSSRWPGFKNTSGFSKWSGWCGEAEEQAGATGVASNKVIAGQLSHPLLLPTYLTRGRCRISCFHIVWNTQHMCRNQRPMLQIFLGAFLYFSFSRHIFLFYVNGFCLHVYLCITWIQNSGRLEERVRSPEIGSTENYIHLIGTERTWVLYENNTQVLKH